ncbi:MAG TPA: 50S ribosomal protein L5 [Saprospiraceae bacterium]|jgi:large subunit ribosomal protein L5|nr:50S ribosomal protein L5 [Saprospiraceae bacterium]HUN15704.1 50S ribosomal protein L5 [Saprospiraceae bacterium]
MGYLPRLKEHYKKHVIPVMMETYKYGSIMEVPRITKVSVNQGIGQATQDKKLVDIGIAEMAMITGQKPVATMSRKAISNFKLREKLPIGVKVTLRNVKMYEFMDRLISVALPRVRDFRGVNDSSFDGRGNFTMGITEQIIFPEVDLDKINKITGMDITFVTTAKTDAEAYTLLKEMGIPFKNQKN